jgi:hypothetical protein
MEKTVRKPIISSFHSIIGIAIKRLVHVAGLQINPSSQNLRATVCKNFPPENISVECFIE